ncbi:sigma-54-dependent Fis family transcriptional regulator [Pedobacter riviphilus]|uniref:Sigma-54-dependent Fis family transcriptional regulator n=1 Tax=Pedobacter riviphilus TaxID=2766984 RepID=A0ABX6TPL1_9SPHI|nr:MULTISPECIES: sigma-54 dependent transcriptional regulator [Pedobacter]NII81223.1 DNA-binding NtrC family response regulator [Pedobacter sp. SG908]NMN35230.1 DNA-binding NtrC family response regulator [Pedobacter sp. SG918]QNR85200.1 sigma-54-dependent Fis family transcriptional regulator [Pedobacter riviphilus]
MNGMVLIIDDEKKISSLLSRIIELEGFKTLQAGTGKEGLKLIRNNDVSIVISDVKLPDVNGVALVKDIKAIKSYIEIINLTAYGTISDGVLAIKNGAFDYLVKGDDNEKIIPLLYKAMDKSNLQRRVSDLENKIAKKHSFETIIGQSKSLMEAIDLAKKVSATDTTVLLLGETGTGKEVFAQSIHYESPRAAKPFVALNCSGFSPDLLESELFGYKAGAFTGANKDKKGLLEEANGGTLLLDEIGEMNLDLQAKLLRVLESQTFIKVGDTQTQQVNVRILAATNKDLKADASSGKFRSDLYYRLSVFTITLPPLRERKADIPALAKYYLKEFADKVNRSTPKMDDKILSILSSHSWKGNIRELKNVIERLVILADGDALSATALPPEFFEFTPIENDYNLQQIEKQHIQKVLIHTKGNKTETSRLLGIGLTTLYRKIEEYQIREV